MPLDEEIYRERGYEPPFDDLPWQEDFLKSKAAAEEAEDAAEEAEDEADETEDEAEDEEADDTESEI